MSMTKLKSNYIKLVIWKINILFYEGGFFPLIGRIHVFVLNL